MDTTTTLGRQSFVGRLGPKELSGFGYGASTAGSPLNPPDRTPSPLCSESKLLSVALRRLKVLLIDFQLTGLLLVGGCTTMEGPASHSSAPNPTKAYVYGSFQRAPNEGINAYGLAIEISNVDTREKKRISLRRAIDEFVYAVEIPPGRYRVTGGLMIAFGAPPDVLPFVGHLQIRNVEFTAEAGSAYYIGDYFGSFLGSTIGTAGSEYISRADYVRIEFVADNYQQTTSKLLNTYPAFEKVKRASALPITGER